MSACCGEPSVPLHSVPVHSLRSTSPQSSVRSETLFHDATSYAQSEGSEQSVFFYDPMLDAVRNHTLQQRNPCSACATSTVYSGWHEQRRYTERLRGWVWHTALPGEPALHAKPSSGGRPADRSHVARGH
jgi:hypothetical protein